VAVLEAAVPMRRARMHQSHDTNATPRPGLEPGAYSLGGPRVGRNRGNCGARDVPLLAPRWRIELPELDAPSPSARDVVCAFCARMETLSSRWRSRFEAPRPVSPRASWVRCIWSRSRAARRSWSVHAVGPFARRRRPRRSVRLGPVCPWCAPWRALVAHCRRSRLTPPISGADRRCPGQPVRAERSEPRSGGLDSAGRWSSPSRRPLGAIRSLLPPGRSGSA
jgi:hypothetical protein